jgi:hypothetical protein
MVGWPQELGQNTVVAGTWGRGASSSHGGQEAKQIHVREEPGQDIAPKDMTLWDLVLPPRFALCSSPALKVYSDF